MRQVFLFVLLLMVSPVQPVFSQSAEVSVLQQLDEQGFKLKSMKRTLLGRVRIISTSDTLWRETVFNPNNGHVLRDIWRPLKKTAGQAGPVLLLAPSDDDDDEGSNGGGSSFGRGSDDDAYDDDSYDDDPEDEYEDDYSDEEEEETDDSSDDKSGSGS